ncbi:MAG: glycosyltransferase family 4 protein [Bacteroidota bacterium]
MHLLYLQQLLVLPGCPGNDRCWRFAQQWTQAGHQVTFLASDAHLPLDHPLRPLPPPGKSVWYQGIEIFFLPVPYDHLFSFRRRVWSFLKFFFKARQIYRQLPAAEAILAYTAPLSVAELGRWLSQKLGLPFYLEVADVWPEIPIGMGVIRSKSLAQFLLRRSQRIYRAAQLIFPYSPGMAQQIQAHGIEQDKLRVVYNGADLDRIPFTPRSLHSPLRLIYTGTVGLANDLTQVLDALAWLEGNGFEAWSFTVIGQGNDLARVQAYARALSLERVVFRPRLSREAVLQVLAEADLGIVSFAPYPVLEANAATKFFDYLAAGLPVLINYQGWQADFLAEWDAGLSVDQGDHEGLAKAIMSLASSPSRRQAMGENGRRLAEQHFDRKVLANLLLQAIEEEGSLNQNP